MFIRKFKVGCVLYEKDFLLMISLCMFSSVCLASMADKVNAISSYTGETKKVSVLLDAPLGYVSNEEIRKIVVDKADEMFPTPQFSCNTI